jgi:hypothetical protein
MLIFVHFARRFGYGGPSKLVNITLNNNTDTSGSIKHGWELLLSEAPYLRHFFMAWIISVTVSYSIYLSMCSFFQVRLSFQFCLQARTKDFLLRFRVPFLYYFCPWIIGSFLFPLQALLVFIFCFSTHLHSQ